MKLFEFIQMVVKRLQNRMKRERYVHHRVGDGFPMGTIFAIDALLKTTSILIIVGEELIVT
jgi:hypothetical protein